MKVAIVVVVLCSVAFASVVRRQAEDTAPETPAARLSPLRPVPPPPPPPPPPADEDTGALVLPSGAAELLGLIVDGFSCVGRIYGYYADQANNCQIFHVCVPAVDEEGNEAPLLHSFMCGNLTVFDQEHLVCAHAADATPCDQAADHYSVNENFGKTDEPPVRSPGVVAVE